MKTRVVSSMCGRTRLRVAHPHRQRKKMEYVAETLTAHPQVDRVQTNPTTGSILIHHDPENGGLNNVLTVLKDLGIIISDLTDGEIVREQSVAAINLTRAIGHLNQRVHRTTNGSIDLKFLFPLGLGLLAFRQLRVNGWQLDLVPWYVLAWYAFDSFIKLNDIETTERSR